MMTMKYFKIAKELNESYHEELMRKEAHFRGNRNSFSLVSLHASTAEIGVSDLKSVEKGTEALAAFAPKSPGRETPEKSLQAWIILHALKNNKVLPFGDHITFMTSEFAATSEDHKRIVNDILGIDTQNNLVVIELKSARTTHVIEQALAFKAFIEANRSYFSELTEVITSRAWSGNVRCIAIWPKPSGRARAIDKKGVEIFTYDDAYTFSIEP